MKYEEEVMQIVDIYVIPWGINILVALLIFFIGRIIVGIVSSLVSKALAHTKWDAILVEFVQQLVRAALLIFVIVAVLDQLGVNTTSVIAVLGAAGLAIGLALQGSLQNFAAGFMLLVFRPFKSGDFVEAAGTMGLVEKIHIFSTIMRSPDNKEVIVPNGAIYSGNIINYSARQTRRVDMVFSIGYGDDIKKARNVIAAIVSADERVLTEPEPVIAVSELGAHSVNFVVRPWVRTEDFWPVKFDLTEKIKLAFDENGISIPFPQMDVHWIKPVEEGEPKKKE
ncbi:mechanosensitive ion channel family protein [Cellvibrio sp. ARAG 10.3]|uniref:mechanosensitive ion channel family protein n=1 Tax=Cellvibrio sp. ARAG 10.3 TaxID=3451358 RepID=UPI003F46A4F2